MTEVHCKYRKPNIRKLRSFGFEPQDDRLVYRTALAEGQMDLTVAVSPEGKIFTQVTDRTGGEEYVLHLVPGAAGAFVGQVRAEYEAALDAVFSACFDPEVFKGAQTKEIIAYVQRTYGDDLEYLWKKFPDNAVVRRKDNQKWYAAILTVSRRKLGLDSDETAEILDLRLAPEEMERTVDHFRYFPGYHMNKKHWITICLDGTLPTEEICRRIDESYRLARGKGG